MHSKIICRALNLDCRQLHLDGNMEKMKAAKREYKDKVEYEVVSPEARFLMTSHHPTKTVDDMIREFKLETMTAYDARARRVRDKALAK